MRDNLQPSMDSWEMRRPDNSKGEWKGRKKKCVSRIRSVIWGRKLGQNPQKHRCSPRQHRPTSVATPDLFPSWC